MPNPIRSAFVDELLKLDAAALRAELAQKWEACKQRLTELPPEDPEHVAISSVMTDVDVALREVSQTAVVRLHEVLQGRFHQTHEQVVIELDEPSEEAWVYGAPPLTPEAREAGLRMLAETIEPEPEPMAPAPRPTPAARPLRPNVPRPNLNRNAANGARTDLSQEARSHGVGADYGAPAQAGQELTGNRPSDGNAGGHQAPASAGQPAALRHPAARPLPAQAVQAPAPRSAGQAQGTPEAGGLSVLKGRQAPGPTPAS
jgi:hypothetical protein